MGIPRITGAWLQSLLARRWLFNVSFPSFPQVRASVSQTQLLKCPLGNQSQHVQNWTHHFLLSNLFLVLCSASQLVTFNHSTQIIHLVTQQGNQDSGAPAMPSCPEHTTHITSNELLTPINSVPPPNTSSGWSLPFPPTATELMPLEQGQMHWPLKVRDLLGLPSTFCLRQIPAVVSSLLHLPEMPFLLLLPS